MRSERGGGESGEEQAHRSEVAGGTQRVAAQLTWSGEAHGMPQQTLAVNNVGAKSATQSPAPKQKSQKRSGAVTKIRGRNEIVRQNIIGRSIAVAGGEIRCRDLLRDGRRKLTLFDEPASEIGGSAFLEILVEQSDHFLAQIGSMAKPGEFVGLERVAGSGEKKLPGRLGTELRHGGLRRQVLREYDKYNNPQVIHGNQISVIRYREGEQRSAISGQKRVLRRPGRYKGRVR